MNNSKSLIEKALKSTAFSHLDIDEIGDDHLYTGLETPMREDAFVLSDRQKKEQIAELFEQIMHVMGLDLSDDSLKGTPMRVAKMYIDEIFSGLNPENKPKVALFENKYEYEQKR
jgi:GTP cyclohydrolase IA